MKSWGYELWYNGIVRDQKKTSRHEMISFKKRTAAQSENYWQCTVSELGQGDFWQRSKKYIFFITMNCNCTKINEVVKYSKPLSSFGKGFQLNGNFVSNMKSCWRQKYKTWQQRYGWEVDNSSLLIILMIIIIVVVIIIIGPTSIFLPVIFPPGGNMSLLWRVGKWHSHITTMYKSAIYIKMTILKESISSTHPQTKVSGHTILRYSIRCTFNW